MRVGARVWVQVRVGERERHLPTRHAKGRRGLRHLHRKQPPAEERRHRRRRRAAPRATADRHEQRDERDEDEYRLACR